MTVPSFDAAFAAASRQFRHIPALRFTPVDANALTSMRDSWRQNPLKDRHSFDWPGIVERIIRTNPNAYSIALYSGPALFGCAMGSVFSGHDSAVTLNTIEGAQLRVAAAKGCVIPCTLFILEAYAREHGLGHVRINRPNHGAFALYEAQPGYEFYGSDMNCNGFEKMIPRPARPDRAFAGGERIDMILKPI